VTKRPEDAIATMVASPYVSLLPALSGGNDREEVAEFYAHHFIFSMPPDMELVSVSRIVGSDHVVEESVLRFTHTLEIDWMLPGVAPTGRRVEVAVC
jgi:carboxymethylenebutenolidase